MANKYNFNGDIEPYGYPKWVDSSTLFKDLYPDISFPDGILLREEAYMLLDHARGKELCVDFGTFKGLSASIMSMVCEKVITIDLYDKYHDMSYEVIQQMGLCNFKNVTALEGDANEIALRFPFACDLVFIDSVHEYKHVKLNFERWFPHVKIGGEILFHDYQAIHPQVIDYIRNEVITRTDVKVIDKCGTIIAFEKVSGIFDH